jgi:hypothetical protein
MRILAFIFLLAGLAAGCHTTEKASEPLRVISILHGTSYGHCRGYCVKEELYQELILQQMQFNRDSVNFPRKTERTSLSDGEFSDLIAAIDWAKWDKLEKVIGCPDCADGGAEYIEIRTNKGTKRVTFDANSDPDGLEKLLVLLRGKREVLERARESHDNNEDK